MVDAIKSPDDIEDYNFIVAERLNNCCNKEEIKALLCKSIIK